MTCVGRNRSLVARTSMCVGRLFVCYSIIFFCRVSMWDRMSLDQCEKDMWALCNVFS